MKSTNSVILENIDIPYYWRCHYPSKEAVESEFKGFSFRGDGWYQNGEDTILILCCNKINPGYWVYVWRGSGVKKVQEAMQIAVSYFSSIFYRGDASSDGITFDIKKYTNNTFVSRCTESHAGIASAPKAPVPQLPYKTVNRIMSVIVIISIITCGAALGLVITKQLFYPTSSTHCICK
jgi:hypothetical protein